MNTPSCHKNKNCCSVNGRSSKICSVILIAIILFQLPFTQIFPLHLQSVAYAQPASGRVSLYHDPNYGISMQYPADWKKEDLDPSNGGIVSFSSPYENKNDTYTEKLEIYFNDLPNNTTLNNYTNTLLRSYQNKLENFTIIESGSSSLAGIPAHRLVFSATEAGFTYKALNVWSIIGDKALIMIYYAEPTKYLTYLPVISKMIESLQIDTNAFTKPTPAGTYVVPSLGLEVAVPHGWSTIDSGTSNSTLLKASPISAKNSSSADRILIFAVVGGRNIASQFERSPDKDLSCGTIRSASIVKINDMKALESELKCNDGMVMKKIKSYMVATKETVIYIGYGASSDSSYENYLTDFDGSIQRLKLTNSTNLSDLKEYASLFGLTTGRSQFEVDSTSYNVDFASNSRITDLELDKKAKKLSFTVDTKETAGETFIRIGNALQGPYAVTIDGNIRDDGILTITDKTAKTSYISLSYEKNRHTIAIVGSDGMPEYSISMNQLFLFSIGLTACIGVAAWIFIRRTKKER